MPSQLGGPRPVAATKTPLEGKHKLFRERDAEEGYVESEVLSGEGVKGVVRQFAKAARNAVEAVQ